MKYRTKEILESGIALVILVVFFVLLGIFTGCVFEPRCGV